MSSDLPTTALAVYQPPEEYRGDITWDPGAASYLEKLAARFALSEMLPKAFRGRPADCAIVLEMAHRLRVTPFMMFQSVSIVHGTPSLSAQFLIAMANAAKRPIKFRDLRRTPDVLSFKRRDKDGARDVFLENWSVTAFFADSPEDKVTVDMQQAMTAGWAHNAKYSEIPAQMLGYRAATFLVRRYLPHLAMGLATIDEVADEQAVVVEAEVVPGAPTPPRGMDAVRAAVAHVPPELAAAQDAVREAGIPEAKPADEPAEDPAAAKAKAELADLRAKVRAIHDLPPEDPRRVRMIAYGTANQVRRWGGLGAEGCREALLAAEQFPTPEPEPAPAAKVTLSQEAVIAIRTLEREIHNETSWPERDLTGWSPEQAAQYIGEMNHKLDELFPQGGE